MNSLRTNAILPARWLICGWMLAVAVAGCQAGHEVKTSGVPQTAAAQARIYIADWANHRIVRINDPTGSGWITCEGSGQHRFQFPVGICVDHRGRIYVAEQYDGRVIRVDDMLGANWTAFLPSDHSARRMNKYAGSWICLGASGEIYLTLGGQHSLVRFGDFRGANRQDFGHEGSGVGEFRYPAGVAVDDADRIYVSDFDNFRLVRIDDMQGTNWTELGSYGSGERQFINPCGICVDRIGRIYIADQGNDRIVRVDDIEGTNWTAIGSFGTTTERSRLYAPTGVCLDSEGRIYITQSSSNHRVVRMDDMTGKNWVTFGSGGADYGQFASPMGICVH